MKTAERIVMVFILFCFLGAVAWIYFSVQYQQKEIRDAVVRGEYEIPFVEKKEEKISPENWEKIYFNTIPVTIGGVSMLASVADTLDSRSRGLSKTPFLPENVVKILAFGSEGKHSIWMKDMEYSIDIIWVNKEGDILHIEEHVSPDSFPESFSTPVPAWYVVETNAGFVSDKGIKIGDKLILK